MVLISHGLYVCRRCRVVFFLFNFLFIYYIYIVSMKILKRMDKDRADIRAT